MVIRMMRQDEDVFLPCNLPDANVLVISASRRDSKLWHLLFNLSGLRAQLSAGRQP
jgi:hypothetical protein